MCEAPQLVIGLALSSMVVTGVGLLLVCHLVAAEEGWAAVVPTFFRPFHRMEQESLHHAHEMCEGLHSEVGLAASSVIVTGGGLAFGVAWWH